MVDLKKKKRNMKKTENYFNFEKEVNDPKKDGSSP